VTPESPDRLVIVLPRPRLLLTALGLPVVLSASLALSHAAAGDGVRRLVGVGGLLGCAALLWAIATYRTSFAFDSRVRVAQRRTAVFGHVFREVHWPFNSVHEVEIVCTATQPKGKGEAPVASHWYQVRLGDLVVAPMLAGDKGRDAALKLARRIADHLSLRVVER